jgi:hypothetical protein
VRPTRTDDDTGMDCLDSTIDVHQLDEHVVSIRLHCCRCHSPLDDAAERRELGLEDPLGLVLRGCT